MATTPPALNQIIPAVYGQLSGDPTLTALLGTFGGSTAIYSGSLIPPTTEFPFISIRPISSVSTDDDKSGFAMVIALDIEITVEEQRSLKILNTIGDRVITLLHKTSLTLLTDTLLQGRLTGQVEAPTDDRISGSILSFEFIII